MSKVPPLEEPMTADLTEAQITELRRLESHSAWPMPWRVGAFDDNSSQWRIEDAKGGYVGGTYKRYDAELYCAMRNSLSALLESRERDKARIAEMEMAAARVMLRVREFGGRSLADEAFGLARIGTDAGEALNTLRVAARLEVQHDAAELYGVRITRTTPSGSLPDAPKRFAGMDVRVSEEIPPNAVMSVQGNKPVGAIINLGNESGSPTAGATEVATVTPADPRTCAREGCAKLFDDHLVTTTGVRLCWAHEELNGGGYGRGARSDDVFVAPTAHFREYAEGFILCANSYCGHRKMLHDGILHVYDCQLCGCKDFIGGESNG